MDGSCSCGAFSFETRKVPSARFVCHCLFCQDFTGLPHADVTVLASRHVDAVGMERLSYRKYRPPPNLNRGRCRICGKPAIETMGAWPLKLMFIPSANFVEQELLPPVHMHVFYNRRVADVTDDLPKYEHYWPSQFAIAKLIIGWRMHERT
jgi:hypothetical protein